jgi:hypothetical protein
VKRLLQAIVPVSTLISLIGCVLSSLLWVTSNCRACSLSLNTMRSFSDHPLAPGPEHVAYSASVDSDSIILARRRGTFGVPWSEIQSLPHSPGQWKWHFGKISRGTQRSYGFGIERARFFHLGNLDAVDALTVPLRPLSLLLAIAPALVLFVRRRRRAARRAKTRACAHGDYDLRATPEPNGARLPLCPGCGAPAQGTTNINPLATDDTDHHR